MPPVYLRLQLIWNSGIQSILKSAEFSSSVSFSLSHSFRFSKLYKTLWGKHKSSSPSASPTLQNKPPAFSHPSPLTTLKSQNNTLQCKFHAVKKKREAFSQVATTKQNLSRMCIHSNAKQTSNASASLKVLLSITMSGTLRADGPIGEGEWSLWWASRLPKRTIRD